LQDWTIGSRLAQAFFAFSIKAKRVAGAKRMGKLDLRLGEARLAGALALSDGLQKGRVRA
jgi:hypothetical protein